MTTPVEIPPEIAPAPPVGPEAILTDLAALLTSVGRHPGTLYAARQLLEGLRANLTNVNELVCGLDERQARLASLLAQLREREWLRGHLPDDDLASMRDDELFSEINARLERSEAELTAVLDLCLQMETLASRIGQMYAPPPSTVRELAELKRWIAEQIETLELELEALADNEEHVKRLLQELSVATPDAARRITTSAMADVILLGRLLAGDRSCLGPSSELGARLADLALSSRALGPLVGVAWQAAPAMAAPLLVALGRRVEAGEDVGDAVAFLVPPGWETAVAACPALAFPLVAHAITAAVLTQDATYLDYLAPCAELPRLHGTLRQLVIALRDARYRDQLAGLREALGDSASVARRAGDAERARTRVLDAIRREPGMTGNYYKLRAEARAHFLKPLWDFVEARDAASALARWTGHGTIEEMVDQTQRSFDRRNELGESHLAQLANYLREFDTHLRGWVGLMRTGTPATLRPVADAWQALHEEAAARAVGSAATLTRIVRTVLEWDDTANEGGRGYVQGPRCVDSADGQALLAPSSLVEPRMTWSYPEAVERGQVELVTLLVETLRADFGAPAPTLPEAVEHYLSEARWGVARAAAEGTPALEALVASRMEQRRSEIRAAHAELLQTAENAKVQDEYVEIALAYVTEAIHALDSASLGAHLATLEEQLRRFRLERDPHRTALVELLREAGQGAAEHESADDLAARVEALRRAAIERRIHLEELAVEVKGLPESVREAWRTLARRLDRPGLWPPAGTAHALAEAVDEFKRYLAGQAEWRAEDPATTDLLVSRFETWLPAQLAAAVAPGGGTALETIFDVARLIRRYAPVNAILRMLGETTLPPRRLAAPAQAEPAPAAAGDTAGTPMSPLAPTSSLVEVVADVRRDLRAHAAAEAEVEPVRRPSAELMKLVAAFDWLGLRRATAAVVLSSPTRFDRLSGEEALYAIAIARTAPDPEAIASHITAVLGVVENPDAEYYLRPEPRMRFLVDAIAVIAGAPRDQTSVGASLAAALERLSSLSSTDPALSYLSQLFTRASLIVGRNDTSGNAQLAHTLWSALTGHKDAATLRSHLLHLLFRLRQLEALRHLAAEAKPLDDALMQCITAFDRSDSAPEVRPRTLQISAAVRERSKGKNRPWVLLFARLEAGFATGDPSASLRASLHSPVVEQDQEDVVTIQVQLTPPPHDAPVRLLIHLGAPDTDSGEGIPLLGDDELLLKEKSVPLRMQRNLLGPPGDEVRVPYRITGHTILGNQLDIRGAWTLQPRRGESLGRLTPEDVQRAWPGAKGDPVKQKDAESFGRKTERQLLRAQLIGGKRPQSVMIFGQRRVGKTSLLYQMIDEFPPRRGAVTGAFVDISGLKPDQGSFSQPLFELICTALDHHELNEPIRRELYRQTGERTTISTLARRLNGDNLFFALEGLVDRLRVHSRGAIHHLALFIDEFDRFVEPLLAGRQRELEPLLWQVRQLVQQSNKIALVLAGSGLQRLLSDDYRGPLFGSVAQVDVGPFELRSDRTAIERTFLPVEVRDRVCRAEDLPALIDTAYEITGGYPFYLAMLGYSAALISSGFKLTSAMLHRAAEQMIRGNVPNLSWRIDAGRFYLHIFETAERLPPRTRAIVKLVLAHIAEQTSPDYPWLAREAIDAVDLPQATEKDRHDALAFLEKEAVIDIDRKSGRSAVRIKVPLTASAVRETALSTREEALRELRQLGDPR